VLCLHRSRLIDGGKDFREFFEQQQADGRRLDLYSCEGPVQLLDPYSYIRLQAWECWRIGAESSYFWSFSDAGGGDLFHPYTTMKLNYAPMFLTPTSVIPGKHIEAMREGVEDYEYFVMLRRAINGVDKNSPIAIKANELLKTGIDKVLNTTGASGSNWREPKDRWEAERVRQDILMMIMELQQSH